MYWWRSIGVYVAAGHVVLLCLLLGSAAAATHAPGGESSTQLTVKDNLPGDLNQDGVVTTLDVVLLTRHLYAGTLLPVNDAAADLDCDGRIAPGDMAMLVRYIYRGQALTPC